MFLLIRLLYASVGKKTDNRTRKRAAVLSRDIASLFVCVAKNS